MDCLNAPPMDKQQPGPLITLGALNFPAKETVILL